MSIFARIRRIPFWSWFWFILGALYFLLPLYVTVNFSLRMERDVIGFKAYVRAFEDPEFLETFLYSNFLALMTIVASIILIVPTAYWIRLRLPEARRIVEFITLLPFVVPAIILVFGLIRIYSAPFKIPLTDITILQPLTTFEVGTHILIVAGYIVLVLPYMYRSVDTGIARSRISDTDYAVEAAELAQAQVLQDFGVSVLAQAN